MSMKDNYSANDLIRRLKDKSHSLRQWSEDLEKEAEVVMDLIKQKEEQIQKLEIDNKNLEKINESLSLGIKEKPFKVFPHPVLKAKKEKSITFKTASETEKVIGYQFRDSVEAFSGTKAAQESHEWDLKDQPTTLMPQTLVLPAEDQGCAERMPMLQEGEETNTAKELHVRREPLKFIHCPWDLLKILLVTLLSFGFCTASTLAYVYFFNSNFIAHRLPVLFNDHDLAELTQYFSPYLAWENDGLLPF
ncbi:hypothetical protein JRQ81_000300 [Phrynocephalus forsythii]|uniref:Uncharacterized protein n=1 Tax=Phrynocephalus forsythii TaxID=171643 RepID=A0A9Q0Y521_9SAUR|nr:hypothetical protein JRQ81_000300 [Phrynocephalus forsythii]